MRVLKHIIFIAIFSLSSCSSNETQPLFGGDTILAFGDSLTAGVGAGKGRDYPTILAELSGLKVVNAGISGETTTQGVIRFQSLLDQHNPSLVILLEGGNDILRSHPATRTKQNLARMITMAQNHGSQIVLIGVPQKKLFSDSAPFYQELADEFNIPFNEDTLAGLLRTPKYKSDPIHLNDAGYHEFARQIHRWFIDLELVVQ
ncbi:MAG: GDSL-type esterase/lipase family protein [Kangiellaceae bacterium]|nr:GDSL-type esterase/lipase family protein [Kangiellaceae bacterium]